MKNLFLLNRSGMSPEVTCRKGRHAIESIVSRFSLASLICLCMLTVGVENAWGADVVQTYTLSTSDNGKSTSTGDVTWDIGSSAIAESSSKCKLTGTISFTLPSGATLKSVQLTGNGNDWGSGATITFKSGNTTLNTFSSCTSFSLTTNKTDLSYSFTKSGKSSKNAWVASITVTYTPGATCSNKVTLTKAATSNGSFTLHSGSASGSEISNGGTVDNCDDAVVVVKPSASTHYHVASVEATNKKSLSGPDASGNYTITYTKGRNVSSTITVTFEEDPKYTVTWAAGSNPSFSAQTNYVGTALTAPGTPSPATLCPGDKSFVGWTATPIAGETNTVPTDLFTSVSGMSIPAENKTYYAVFAKITNTYTKITTAADFTSGNYLVVNTANSKAMKAEIYSSNYLAAADVTISATTISNPAASLIWEVKKDGTTYTLYNTSVSKYCDIVASGRYGKMSLTASSKGFTASVSSGNWSLSSKNISGQMIRYNSSYTEFQAYNAIPTGYEIQLYKQGVSAYATTCASCDADPTVGAATKKGDVGCSSMTVQCASGITNIGGTGCSISSYGFEYSTSSTFASAVTQVEVGKSYPSANAAFEKEITGLSAGTTYYVRTYATNGYGTAYGTSCTIAIPASRTITLSGSPAGTLTGGTISADNSSACVGTIITLTATPSSHYSFGSWTVTKAGGGTVTVTSNQFTMPDENVTVSATFTENEYKTVKFYNNGTAISGYDNVKVYVGESPTAPSLTDGASNDACDATSDKHYGWTRTSWGSTKIDKATIDAKTGTEAVYTKSGSLPVVAAGDPATIEYHAVWAKQGEGSGSGDISSTLIAKWDKQELTASTAVKAKDASGNTLNSVTLTSNIAMSTEGVYCKAASTISTNPQITIAGLDFSSYDGGVVTFFARGSQQATVTVEYSTDGGSSYSTDYFSDGSMKKELGYVVTVPKTTTNVKISYGSNTGNFYFGTVRAYGTTTTSYEFTELTSSNTSGWTGSAWDGYYLVTGNSSAKALRSDVMEGLYGHTAVTASDGKISTSDLGLIFKVTYNSGTEKYAIQSVATQDYLTDNAGGFGEAYHLLETSATEAVSMAYNDIANASGYYVRWNSDRFGSYAGCTNVTLYKIYGTYEDFLTTCCEAYDITLENSGTVAGGTFSASAASACEGHTVTLSNSICEGYTVGAWTIKKTSDASDVTASVLAGTTLTMPAYGVTISLATTAKTDHFIDKMHGKAGYTGEGKAISGCAQTVPNPGDASAPADDSCEETHYKFVGWVEDIYIDTDGTAKTSQPGFTIIEGGTTDWNASGKTYYAVWAELK